MLIRHLRYFVTLAQEQHFGRAAEICNVTQPTLSQAIRKLETDLGVALIVRNHRFLSLTAEGEKVLRWGRQILADHDSLQDDLGGRRRGLTGTLRLGVIPAAMPSVAFLSEQFELRHPLAGIEVRSMSSRAIQRGLDSFEIDGGLTYLENEPLENVARVPLYHEKYAFACPPGHRFAGRVSVTWAEAMTEPLCLLSEDMQNRRILNGIAASAGTTLRPRIVSNSFLGVASHLRHGRWCAVVPHTFAFVFGAAEDLVLREMTEPAHRQLVGLVLSDREPRSPMAAALAESAREMDLERRFADAFSRAAAEARA